MYSVFEKLISERNITPYRVAKDAKVSQSSLSDWKHGKGTPKYETLKKLADYFDVTVDYLLTGEEVPWDQAAAMAEKYKASLRKDSDSEINKVDTATVYDRLDELLVKEEAGTITASEKEERNALWRAFVEELLEAGEETTKLLTAAITVAARNFSREIADVTDGLVEELLKFATLAATLNKKDQQVLLSVAETLKAQEEATEKE